MGRLLYIPIDFTARDDVRMLGRILFERKTLAFDEKQCDAMAAVFALQLWEWWARTGEKVRPWRNAKSAHLVQGGAPVQWDSEPLSYLIETGCGWLLWGNKNTFAQFLVEAGVLIVGPAGVELAGFAEMNPHLLPGHLSHQARGGKMKARNRAVREAGKAAPSQLAMLLGAGSPFMPTDNEEHSKTAVALIMQLDAACGRAGRKREEFSAGIVRDAIAVVRRFSADELGAVIERAMDLKESGSALDAESIIRDFSDHVAATTDTEQ